ncbi:TolC family outer membrane protein [Thermochromatium tepidum]|uniref:TolC family outer membrane protein n=1 Tax=Thermochromatium tepidum ATCC 43061 TaxID=316276 RepID=A0A6I6DW40_THETI|nr:TolC family outer membrane protein [Thermochromatium tepidum]QGU31681.1 TolC family outer membrane protein [Thermochromatium tepidum ATCC 43061]
MRRILPALIALSLGGSPLPSLAEDLLQIYDRAVVSDPKLREAEQTLFATREFKPQARSLLLPSLSLKGEADLYDLDSRGGSSIDRRDHYDTQKIQAVVSQSLFNRANWMTLQKAERVVAQAEAEYRSAQIDLMVRTTKAYFDVLRASDAVTVREALVRADERQLEQAKQRFEVGLVAITDVNESQAAYDKSRADLISAKNQLDNAWEALRTIVGPISVPLARLGEKLPLSPPEPNDLQAWASTALSSNYSILAAIESVNAARAAIEIERSGHLPKLELQAGYDISRSNAQYYGTDSETGFVGLSLTVPLFEGGSVTSKTREAGYKYRAAQDRLDQVRRQVDQQTKDAFRGILSSIEDVRARQAAIVSARSALESTQAGLEVGTRTQVDVLNAQRSLFQAEFDYMSARYDYILNGIKLHQATSTLTREVLAKGNAWLNPNDTVPPPAY